ncbi:MAG: glycosyltransferase family 4 protein [Bdellovibrionales bacterium]|nr:glycosyltransferase family 4 protein [Bdellovibrionales bacterium]
MKIFLVTNSLGLGGAQRSIIALAQDRLNLGDSVTMVFVEGTENAFYSLPQELDIVSLNGSTKSESSIFKKLGRLFRASIKFRKEVSKQQPGVVISFLDQVNVLALIATLFMDVPIIVSERSHPSRTSLVSLEKLNVVRCFWRFLRNILYRQARFITVLTPPGKSYFPKLLHHKIYVTPNVVPKPISQESDIKLDQKTILWMGRFAPVKRVDLLIRAFSLIEKNHPDWTVNLVGDGPEKVKIETMILALGLSDRVKIHPATQSPYKTLSQARLFVNCSDWEGFGLSLTEAMSVGLPVISTECWGGEQDIVQDGVNGLLVPVGDVDALAVAITKLIEDPDLSKQLGANAKHITDKFSSDKVFGNWNELIQKAIKK